MKNPISSKLFRVILMSRLKNRVVAKWTFSLLKIILAKTGGSKAFRREEMGFIIDITFVSDILAKDLQKHVG